MTISQKEFTHCRQDRECAGCQLGANIFSAAVRLAHVFLLLDGGGSHTFAAFLKAEEEPAG